MNETQAQLEWEARAGRQVAIAAFASTACVLGTFFARASIGKGSSKKAESLRIAHDHTGAIVAYAVLTAISFVLMAAVLLYLYKAVRFRKPELPSVAAYTAALGPVLMMISGIAGTILFLGTADDFVSSGAQTEARAKDLLDSGAGPAVTGIGFAGTLTTAVALVLISLNAMRVGLFSRFMGIIGIAFGALLVLPILPGPVLQLFWVTAVGVLLLDRWPGGGRGPAWETGEAIEWPSNYGPVDQEEQDSSEPEVIEAEPPEPVSAPNPNARSRKRKKKKARR